MSRDASVELTFAGDSRLFRLSIDNMLALEDACDAGCAEILERLQSNRWRVRDVREPIRLGLIGAGVDGRIAKRMMDENVLPGRLAEHVLVAQAVIMTALVGDMKETVGKPEAEADEKEATGAFPLPLSTVQAQQ